MMTRSYSNISSELRLDVSVSAKAEDDDAPSLSITLPSFGRGSGELFDAWDQQIVDLEAILSEYANTRYATATEKMVLAELLERMAELLRRRARDLK